MPELPRKKMIHGLSLRSSKTHRNYSVDVVYSLNKNDVAFTVSITRHRFGANAYIRDGPIGG